MVKFALSNKAEENKKAGPANADPAKAYYSEPPYR